MVNTSKPLYNPLPPKQGHVAETCINTMIPSNITYASTFQGLPINASSDLGAHTEIIQNLHDRFLYMANHPTVLGFMVAMFDLRFPQMMPCPTGNGTLVRFVNSLHQSLRRAGLEHQYVWVYECSQDEGHHYHVCLLIEDHPAYPFAVIIRKIHDLWGCALGIMGNHALVWDYTRDSNGYPLLYPTNGTVIRRDDPYRQQLIKKMFYWSSYLGKTRSKNGRPMNVKAFGASRLPPTLG